MLPSVPDSRAIFEMKGVKGFWGEERNENKLILEEKRRRDEKAQRAEVGLTGPTEKTEKKRSAQRRMKKTLPFAELRSTNMRQATIRFWIRVDLWRLLTTVG